jgi:hypothetical protein
MTMMNGISRAGLAGAWCAAVIVLGACAIVAGVGITAANGELWLMACLLPPTVMLLVWRDRPPLPIPLVAHVVNSTAKEARP